MRHLILFALGLIFSTSSSALTINISIKGQNVQYENSRDWGRGYYVATTSEIFSTLEPTQKWIPAMSRVSKEVTLKGVSSGTAKVQVVLHGLEYDWGSLNFTKEINNNMGLEGGSCSNSITSSTTIIFSSSHASCIGTSALKTNASLGNPPFYFVRPIFQINKLLEGLRGQPEGIYTGSVNIPFRYYFYNDMSVLTYRNLTMNLTFQVNYVPDVFSSLIVTPENGGIINPEYGSGTVEGFTRFNIEVKGYFSTGIKMKFDTSKDYSLAHSARPEKKIPYYIHCDTCEEKIIVKDNGKMNLSVLNDSGVVFNKAGSDKTSINYNLTIGYSEKTINDVISGSYSDNFVVIFGLDF